MIKKIAKKQIDKRIYNQETENLKINEKNGGKNNDFNRGKKNDDSMCWRKKSDTSNDQDNLEDDQMSIVSHDTIFSNFKADIRKDNIEDEHIDEWNKKSKKQEKEQQSSQDDEKNKDEKIDENEKNDNSEKKEK